MTTGRSHPRGSGKVSRQVVLPFRTSLRISLQSLRVRFLRSLITTLSLALAIAFFSFVLVGTDVATGLMASNNPQLVHKLERAGYGVATGESSAAGRAKDRWLVILALLVCVVGIVNAQLMAVTERFREIGTIKCLGALDSFVVRLFVLEAAIQGLLGSGAGSVIGGLVAVVVGMLRFGAPAWQYLPLGDAAFSVITAGLVGVALSVAGVLYPALVAARMQPVEAMRVEQ